MLILLLSIPPHLFQPCSVSSFPLLTGLSHISPPIFHLSTPLLSLFAPASTSQLAQLWSDHPPRWHPRLSDTNACLCFPLITGGQNEFLVQTCAYLPLSGCPPFPSTACAQVPVGPRFFLSGGPLLPLPVSVNLIPPPPAGRHGRGYLAW